MQQPRVLVVGSGPAGLVLALSLLKNGISVRIIEKDEQHHTGERGPGVMPRTLEIEKFLGVGDAVQKTGVGVPKLHIFDPNDPHRIIRTSVMFEEVQSTPAYPIMCGVMLGQWRHQAILREYIEKIGGKVELGCTFIGFEQDQNGVIVEIAKVVNGVEQIEKAKFDYVVGADGGRSSVRKAMGVKFLGETREEGKLYIVDVRIQGTVGKEGIFLWGNPHKTSAALRESVEPGLYQLIITGPETNFDGMKANNDIKTVQAEFNKLSGRTDLVFTEITWQGEWRPNIRMTDHFQVGRVFIIGDAAHAHPPTGGQGLNSSIQDAFNLGWKLALSVKGLASSNLLESYEVERLPVIAEMLKLSTELFNKHFSGGPRSVERLQQAAEQQSQAAPKDECEAWFRGRKLFQLDIHYRWSTIVYDERFTKHEKIAADVYGVVGNDIRAGNRAPDAPGLIPTGGEGPSRLFDIFSPTTHTILVFATHATVDSAREILEPFEELHALVRKVIVFPGDDAASSLPSLGAEHIFMDSEGHAFTGYGIDKSSEAPIVVVIRPDAMVGAFLISKEGAREYISSVFK